MGRAVESSPALHPLLAYEKACPVQSAHRTGAGMSFRFDDFQDPDTITAPEATAWPDGFATPDGQYGLPPGYGSFAPPALNFENQLDAQQKAQPRH